MIAEAVGHKVFKGLPTPTPKKVISLQQHYFHHIPVQQQFSSEGNNAKTTPSGVTFLPI